MAVGQAADRHMPKRIRPHGIAATMPSIAIRAAQTFSAATGRRCRCRRRGLLLEQPTSDRRGRRRSSPVAQSPTRSPSSSGVPPGRCLAGFWSVRDIDRDRWTRKHGSDALQPGDTGRHHRQRGEGRKRQRGTKAGRMVPNTDQIRPGNRHRQGQSRRERDDRSEHGADDFVTWCS